VTFAGDEEGLLLGAEGRWLLSGGAAGSWLAEDQVLVEAGANSLVGDWWRPVRGVESGMKWEETTCEGLAGGEGGSGPFLRGCSPGASFPAIETSATIGSA
jgi:hypothetical protein